MSIIVKPSKEKVKRLMDQAKNGTINIDELETIKLTVSQKQRITKLLNSRKN